jgi:hypothetical protein
MGLGSTHLRRAAALPSSPNGLTACCTRRPTPALFFEGRRRGGLLGFVVHAVLCHCEQHRGRYTELMSSIQGGEAGQAAAVGGTVGEAAGQFEQAERGEAGDVATVEAGESPVNYEEAALLELEIDGTDYRLDIGRAGTAMCISTRPSGSWSWVFRGEARWQLNTLRCKAFERDVLSRLSSALAEAANDSQS